MTRKIQRAILVIVMIGTAIGIAAGLGQLKPPPESKPVRAESLLVEVMEVSRQDASFSVASQGTVLPRTETVLSAEVAGSIVEISPRFVAGGFFEKGEMLLRIDPAPYEVAVEQAEALLKQRQIEYDGAQSLQSRGYRAEAELAAAAAALASARAALVNARRDLDKTRIRLPYAGMVRSKEADLGQFVSRGTRLGVAFATDYAEVRLSVTDNDLAFIDLPLVASDGPVNGPAVMLSATQRGRPVTWQGRITRTEGIVDEQTRMSWLVARVDDPYQLRESAAGHPPLPVGTFVRAEIDGRDMQGLVRVPRSALRGGDELVVVDDDDRIRLRKVDVLRADTENAWIDKGIEAGERISLTPLESPINGMQVRTEAGDRAVAATED